MGNRVSISFKKDNEESVALFSHWGGTEFYEEALAYATKLKQEVEGKQCKPIERLEPNTVMVDFIREITEGMERVEYDLYLGKDKDDGDNSDNGHFVIDLGEEDLGLSVHQTYMGIS